MPSELPSFAAGSGLVDVDLDHRQIRLFVRADHLGIVLHARRIVLQLHANAISFIHHVAVGDDVSLGIDNDTGTQRTLAHTFRPAALSTLSAKELVEEVLERIFSRSSPPPGPWSGACGPGCTRRRCGFLIVDSVLMFTTVGSSCFEICVKALESCFGAGICKGVASEEELDPFCPFTP